MHSRVVYYLTMYLFSVHVDGAFFCLELCHMAARADQAHASLMKPFAISLLIVGIAVLIWPSYRKFFINEWRERIAQGQPVVFIPDCPATLAQLRCGDQYTVVFRKNETNQWCSRVRKNEDPAGSESCGLDIDAWDFARSWRYFTVEGVRFYYSWRGRVISSDQAAGWLVAPENLALRKAHPISVQ